MVRPGIRYAGGTTEDCSRDRESPMGEVLNMQKQQKMKQQLVVLFILMIASSSLSLNLRPIIGESQDSHITLFSLAQVLFQRRAAVLKVTHI